MRVVVSTGALVLVAIAALGDAAADPPGSLPEGAGRFATDPVRLTVPTVVSARWLSAHAAEVVVLDARPDARAYAQGHLPRAVHAPVDSVRADRGDVPDELLDRNALAARFGGWGVAADSSVVVYGGDRLVDATLIVLALCVLGHQRVAILEGGLEAWRHAGLPLAAQPPPTSSHVYEAATTSPALVADLASVVAASRDGATLVLDVRPAAGFLRGHVPGARSRPVADDVVTTDSGVYWRPVEELERAYAGLGAGKEVPVVVTCSVGLQASQTWFTLAVLLGRTHVRWYDGSWAEWSRHRELPVATGPASPRGR